MASTEKRIRKTEHLSVRLSLIGGGAGLGLFAVFGVLNASFIGGIIGVNIAGLLLGFPVESGMLSRGIVALGMLLGIMLAGLMFIIAGALTGWSIGKLIDLIRNATFNKGKSKESQNE